MNHLKSVSLKTPLGNILAIADEKFLYLLEFEDSAKIMRQVEHLKRKTKLEIIPGRTEITDLIENELNEYFSGNLKVFKTPLFLCGTSFQNQVWEFLQQIPFGKTISYLDLSLMTGRAQAYRAVAQANGANLMPIIIPCHRVINKSGAMGGYSGGLKRKEWLLKHEQA